MFQMRASCSEFASKRDFSWLVQNGEDANNSRIVKSSGGRSSGAWFQGVGFQQRGQMMRGQVTKQRFISREKKKKQQDVNVLKLIFGEWLESRAS